MTGSPGITANESDDILNGLFCHYATRTTYITPEELWSNLNQIRLAPMSEARISMRQLSMLATELHLVPHLLSKDIALGKIVKTCDPSRGWAGLGLSDFKEWIFQCSQELFGDENRGAARLLGQMSASGQFEKISEAWAHADHNIGPAPFRSLSFSLLPTLSPLSLSLVLVAAMVKSKGFKTKISLPHSLILSSLSPTLSFLSTSLPLPLFTSLCLFLITSIVSLPLICSSLRTRAN